MGKLRRFQLKRHLKIKIIMNIKLKDSGAGRGLRVRVLTLTAALTLTGVAAFVPIAAMADHTTAHTIDQLSAQITALQAQLTKLSGTSSTGTGGAMVGKCTFTKSLTVGSRGDDVKCLQMKLNVSPASGYFGPLTKAAVVKWQKDAGVSPASGYFGPISQAKYSSMAAITPAASPTPPGATPPVAVPAGSGLTVTAPVDQPASQLAPGSAARVPFVKAILTASADGDVTVKSVTVERRGPSDDANFDSILLLDENGMQIGNTKTLSSEHKVTLNNEFVVKAGTSKTVTIAANMVAIGSINSGQIAKFAITAVDAGSSKVNASLPIEGNGMTMNSTLTIGSVTMSIGSLDPGSANTKNVGTSAYYLASVKAAVGSAEDVTFQSIRFNQSGSAAASDLANVMVNVGGKDYPATVTSDGKYWAASLGDGIAVIKGNNLEFSVKADLVSGSARTVDMDILRKSDVVVKGKTFGYNIVVGGGSSGAASAGAFSSNQEPFFNSYVTTINKGSILISRSSSVTSGNIPVSVTDTTLGAFTFDVKGEPMQISSLTLNFTFTGTGTSSNLTGLKLFDSNGGIVAGPKDPSSGIVTWTDTWTAPVALGIYTVKGKLSTTFVTNDTVQVGMNPDNITVKGTVTGLTVSAAPAATLVNANSQNVRSGAMSMSVASTPFSQTVVRGVNQFGFSSFTFDATQSGEDVRVTSVKLRDTISATGVGDEINSCAIYDGATALTTGGDVISPSDPSSGTTNDVTFTLTNNLIVTKGTTKTVDLKCNVSSSATANSTHAWGINDTTATNVSGTQTGTAITESVTTGTGNTMTVKGAGSFTVVKDASAPSATLVLSSKTDVPMNVLKYHATDEAINITELTLTYSSSTASTSDFLKATVWDGATKIGEAVWAGGAQNATTTFTTAFSIPKDADRLLTIKADIASIDVNASSTPGRLLAVDYNGVSSSTGTGQSSGVKLGSSSNVNTVGASMQIMKSLPTFAKIAVPSTTLPQTNAVLYRFSVAADPAGPVALYKFTFLVSSSTVSATTSTYNVFGYSDSSFSVKAYDNNPVNSRAVGCAGQSTFDSDTTCNATDSTGSVTASTSVATSSQIVFFFNPVNYVASTSEAIVVPAGTTRYFELRGDIRNPGSGTGNNISVSLAGDIDRPIRNTTQSTVANVGQSVAAGPITANHGLGSQKFINNYGVGFLASAAEVALQSDRSRLVWSAMSTTTTLTGATTTQDWTNGFLVPGLPISGMSANTFSN